MLSLPDPRSTQPYLMRAMFEWCVDQGLTPYLLVKVNAQVRVPMEFVKNGEIVLNISPEATGNLSLGNEWIEFKARFGGVARDILVPVHRVAAIFAKENAQGLGFVVSEEAQVSNTETLGEAAHKEPKSPWLQVVSDGVQNPVSSDTDKVLPHSAPTPETSATDEEPPHPPSSSPAGDGKSHLKRIK